MDLPWTQSVFVAAVLTWLLAAATLQTALLPTHYEAAGTYTTTERIQEYMTIGGVQY